MGVGDLEFATLDVSPADNSTQATLTVEKPDGTSLPVTTIPGALTPVPGTDPVEYDQQWTSEQPVAYDSPGRWVLHWAVTGTGQGSEDLEVYVVASPVAGGPTWLPGRSRVANYLPHRTLERSVTSTVASQDVYDMSFTSNTVPSGVMVDRLIADGASWLLGRVVNLAPSLYGAASVIVTLYAAAAVERGAPVDDVSLQRANDFEKRMDAQMADLIEANEIASGGGGLGIVYPVWSFERPDPRWDYSRYW
jgi:hypothetical protein